MLSFDVVKNLMKPTATLTIIWLLLAVANVVSSADIRLVDGGSGWGVLQFKHSKLGSDWHNMCDTNPTSVQDAVPIYCKLLGNNAAVHPGGPGVEIPYLNASRTRGYRLSCPSSATSVSDCTPLSCSTERIAAGIDCNAYTWQFRLTGGTSTAGFVEASPSASADYVSICGQSDSTLKSEAASLFCQGMGLPHSSAFFRNVYSEAPASPGIMTLDYSCASRSGFTNFGACIRGALINHPYPRAAFRDAASVCKDSRVHVTCTAASWEVKRDPFDPVDGVAPSATSGWVRIRRTADEGWLALTASSQTVVNLVCARLGFPAATAALAKRQYRVLGNRNTLSSENRGRLWISCSSSATRLEDCSSYRRGYSSSDSSLLAVECGTAAISLTKPSKMPFATTPTFPAPSQHAIVVRSQTTAAALCRALGFTTATPLYDFQRNSVTSFLELLSCSSTLTGDLQADCTLRLNYGFSSRSMQPTASLICTNMAWNAQLEAQPTNLPRAGRLLVRPSADFAWGTVCRNGWNNNDANAACRSLGFITSDARYWTIGSGSGSVYIEYPSCSSSAQGIADCEYMQMIDPAESSSLCSHSNDLGIDCHEKPWEYRLARGTATAGAFEVRPSSIHEWGYVCSNNNFDGRDARVMCRSLGLGNPKWRENYGGGTGPTYFTNLGCDGDEAGIANCSSAYSVENNDHCTSTRVAAVDCTNYTWEYRLRGENRALHATTGVVELRPSSGDPWGTICPDDRVETVRVASRICAKIGVPNPAPHFSFESWSSSFASRKYLDEIRCDAADEDLEDCTAKFAPSSASSSTLCSTSSALMVDCGSANWEYRLVGTKSTFGRLEVRPSSSAQWGSVTSGLDNYEARVACKSLGFSGNQGRAINNYGGGSGPRYIRTIHCLGTEARLDECYYMEYDPSTTSSHSGDIGIDCTDYSWEYRLVGGNTTYGRLELRPDSQSSWGTVCDDSFTQRDAIRACASLGMPNPKPRYFTWGSWSSGSGTIYMDNTDCMPSDKVLKDCNFVLSLSGYNRDSCSHSEDIGVECGVLKWEFRLSGNSATRGRLLARPGPSYLWGTVSGSMSSFAAKAACRSLGHSDRQARAVTGASGGSGPVYMSGVSCSSTATGLDECAFTYNPPQRSVSHSSDVLLDCTDYAWEYRLAPGSQLINGKLAGYGRLEVRPFASASWGTVCDDNFGTIDAVVACKSLGFPNSAARWYTSGGGSGPIYMDRVSCSGDANSLADCYFTYSPSTSEENHGCSHSEDVGIDCMNKTWEYRLVKESGATARGRLEARPSSAFSWGTVCDSGFGSAEADLACKELGFTTSQSRHISNYGGGSGTVYMKIDGSCPTTSTELTDCGFSYNLPGTPSRTCSSHSDDVGVDCTNYNWQFTLDSSDYETLGRLRARARTTDTLGYVCRDSFSNTEAVRACASLGMPNPEAVSYRTSDWSSVSSSSYFPIDDVDCSRGNPTKLEDCDFIFSLPNRQRDNCGSNDDIGVDCTVKTWKYKLERAPFMSVGVTTLTMGAVFVQAAATFPWGHVRYRTMDRANAAVACRSLGLPTSQARGFTISGSSNVGRLFPFIENYDCAGSETSVDKCSKTYRPPNSTSLSTSTTFVDCTEYAWEYRLAGSTIQNIGRLEVRPSASDNWGTVCNSNFGRQDAITTCASLGTPNPKAEYFQMGGGEGTIWMTSVQCTTSDTKLGNCFFHMSYPTLSRTGCSHTRDVGVDCAEKKWEYRLTGGTATRGRLEIRPTADSPWGHVCSSGFDSSDAIVACRSLNLSTTQARRMRNFGASTTHAYMSGVNCGNGGANELGDCSFSYRPSIISSQLCSASTAVGIDCTEYAWEFRLGETQSGFPHAGALELRPTASDSWGYACDDSFSSTDAIRACNSLGFPNPRARAWGKTVVEAVSNVSYIDEIQCSSNDEYLPNCTFDFYTATYPASCGTSKAFVDCTVPEWEYRLVGGTTAFGRLEVRPTSTASWGTVCDDNFGNSDAKVACKALGFTSGSGSMIQRWGGGSGTVYLNDVGCGGDEDDFIDCNYDFNLPQRSFDTCSHSEDVGVDCTTYNWDFRLVGGTVESEGRLEVRPLPTEPWGTVCKETLSTSEARLLCKALGYDGLYAKVSSASGGEGTIWISNTQCPSSATNFTRDCQFQKNNRVKANLRTSCTHSDDLFLSCEPPFLNLRLNPSLDEFAGVLEAQVVQEGQYGPVCARNVDSTDRRVICNNLGFFNADPVMLYIPNPSQYGAALRVNGCSSSSENFLSVCDISTFASSSSWTSSSSLCRYSSSSSYQYWYLGIDCREQNPSQFVRLSGSTPSIGIVEYRWSPQAPWGMMCFPLGKSVRSFARDMCSRAGYSSLSLATARLITDRAELLSRNATLLFDEDGCTEDEYTQCDTWNTAIVGGCPEGYGALELTCRDPEWEYRFAGSGGSGGLVEVRPFRTLPWGTICDDQFTTNDAKMICRAMGRSPNGATFRTTGGGFGPIYLKDMNCDSSDEGIDGCSVSDDFAPEGLSSCTHVEDISVFCDPSEQFSVASSFSVTGSLVAPAVTSSVRNAALGVCGAFDNVAASVVCAAVGQRVSYPLPAVANSSSVANEYIQHVRCPVGSSSLTTCSLGSRDINCDAGVLMGANCVEHSFEYRFQSAPAATSGVLEVRITPSGGQPTDWGLICDDEFGFAAANAVCSSLGLGNAGISMTQAGTSGGNQTFLMSSVRCSGSESALHQCSFLSAGPGICTDTKHAVGVNCRPPADRNPSARTFADDQVYLLIVVGLGIFFVVVLVVFVHQRRTLGYVTAIVEEIREEEAAAKVEMDDVETSSSFSL